jgi:hypothetical protein
MESQAGVSSSPGQFLKISGQSGWVKGFPEGAGENQVKLVPAIADLHLVQHLLTTMRSQFITCAGVQSDPPPTGRRFGGFKLQALSSKPL